MEETGSAKEGEESKTALPSAANDDEEKKLSTIKKFAFITRLLEVRCILLTQRRAQFTVILLQFLPCRFLCLSKRSLSRTGTQPTSA